jgi:hypothetical protein
MEPGVLILGSFKIGEYNEKNVTDFNDICNDVSHSTFWY